MVTLIIKLLFHLGSNSTFIVYFSYFSFSSVNIFPRSATDSSYREKSITLIYESKKIRHIYITYLQNDKFTDYRI